MNTFYLLLGLLFAPGLVSASVPGHLDKPYGRLVHPKKMAGALHAGLPDRSDVHALIAMQTPIRDQQDRGTCSIFSTTALLESMLRIKGQAAEDIDLSEEWLAYLTNLHKKDEGSTSPDNFQLMREYGMASEQALPYLGVDWTGEKVPEDGIKRCANSRGWMHGACLSSHRDPRVIKMEDASLLDPANLFFDPDFVGARNDAFATRDRVLAHIPKSEGIVTDVQEIHSLLAQGIPLTLEMDFYLGSWNHPAASKYGINRSMELWKKGVVTYPEKGSADRAYSKKDGEGHSILVVGYDDNIEVEYHARMTDGSMQKFKRRGVYYFKNSWGTTDTMGVDFAIDGRPYPGYGMILQDHAHDFGQFFRLKL
jgi:hypothetical protein